MSAYTAADVDRMASEGMAPAGAVEVAVWPDERTVVGTTWRLADLVGVQRPGLSLSVARILDGRVVHVGDAGEDSAAIAVELSRAVAEASAS